MKKPLVSVLLPVYNCEDYIQETIESVLNQTFIDFELIIVNDGSTDQSSKIIKKFAQGDNRIIVISKENGGLSHSLNTGLRIARGKYIARIDSDDICMKDRLQIQVDFLEKHFNYIMVGSSVKYINELGQKLGYSHVYISDRAIKEKLLTINPIAHPSVMIRKIFLDKVNGYESNIRQDFEDFYLWHRLKFEGKFYNIPKPLIKYRILENSISSGGTDEYTAAVMQISMRGNITKEEYNRIKLLKRFKDHTIKKSKSDQFIKFQVIAYLLSMFKTYVIKY